MKRRTFLKTLSVGLVGSSLIDPTDLFASPPEDVPVMSVVRGTDPALMAAEAVQALGGISTFVSKGDVVLVKPNIGWDRTPEQAANTNPTVVATLVKLAYEAGAKKVKVFDFTCNSARRCYKRSGIAAAAEDAGAEVSFVEDRNFKKTKLGGENLKEWPIHKEAMEADKIVNVPIAKHHTLARISLSMKNLMGMIGGRRNVLHQELGVNLADLAAFFKPTIVVLDAVRILTANGPQGGNLKDVAVKNIVAASRDQVAIDSFGATLFGMTGDDLPVVREAFARGLGEKDLSNIRILERTV